MFIQKELISEIRYYQSRKDDFETEDLLRAISGMKALHKKELKELGVRIEKLGWCLLDSM